MTGCGAVCCPLRVDEHLGQTLCAAQHDVKSCLSLPIHREDSLFSLILFSSRRENKTHGGEHVILTRRNGTGDVRTLPHYLSKSRSLHVYC